MRKGWLGFPFAICLLLAGCVMPEPTDPKAEALAKLIKVSVETSCAVSPSLIDIGTAVAASSGGTIGALAAGPLNVIVKTWTKQICDQWKAKQSIHTLAEDGCVATINDVCIRVEQGS